MYNRGNYKNKTFWSHGNLAEGFQFCVGKKDKDGNYEEIDKSGWFTFKPLLKGFEKAVKTGKFQDFTLKDDEGRVHKFTKHEQELLMDEYLDSCFENLSNLSLKKKLKLINNFSLTSLSKLVD